MRKTIALFVLTLVICSCVSATPIAVAEGEADRFESWNETDFLKDFVSNNLDRTVATAGEEKAGDYVLSVLEKMGYTTRKDNGLTSAKQRFDYVDSINGDANVGYNIVARKDVSGATEFVIIGCHYDNLTSYELNGEKVGGEGAGEATGVAVMLKLAYDLRYETLPFNVVFVAFGGNQLGLYGAEKFIGTNQSIVDNTLLMINLDSVGVGDYLYMYADEVSTKHEDFVYDLSEKLNLDVRKPPKDKKIVAAKIRDDSKLPYHHKGLLSENSLFLDYGVNTLNLFGYNWTGEGCGGESENHPDIVGTKRDTLSNYLAYYSESGQKKMETATALVKAAVTAEDFSAVMKESKKEKFDYSWLVSDKVRIGVSLGILAALAAAAALVYVKLDKIQKNSKKAEDKSDDFQKQSEKVFEDF